MIGENIKKIRELKKIGINELARRANISGSYLSNIEKGIKTNPSVKALEKIASALGVFPEEFLSQTLPTEETLSFYDLQSFNTKKNIVPEKFTSPDEAREYIEMHKIFASNDFDVNNLSDEDVLEFGNSLLEQAKMVGYKYKK